MSLRGNEHMMSIGMDITREECVICVLQEKKFSVTTMSPFALCNAASNGSFRVVKRNKRTKQPVSYECNYLHIPEDKNIKIVMTIK